MSDNLKNILIGLLCAMLLFGIIMLVGFSPKPAPIILLPTSTALPVTVYVTGAVQDAGVYTFPPGSRITDAIEAAGGFLPDADQIHINLASILVDGQQIYILYQNETVSDPILQQLTTNQSSSSTPLIDINIATESDLETIPGIGETRALAIINFRDQYGPITDFNQLLSVPGIGDTILEQIIPYLYISPNP